MLLDLLGGADPLITNHFDNTKRWFDRLVAAGEIHLGVPVFLQSSLPVNSAPFISPLLREEAPQTGPSGIPPLRADLLQEGPLPGTRAG